MIWVNTSLQGDTGGHTGTAPTNLHHIFPRIPHKQNNHLHAIHPNDINRPTRNPTNKQNHPHAICPNETVGAVPTCPPERPRSGVSIWEIGFVYHALCAGITMDEPLLGDADGHIGTAPTQLHQTTRCAITHCTFDSSRQPRGVALPRSGYTFESAGLASVTQPTLGNDASEEATPLGVVLFLIAHHHHTVPNE